MRLKIKCSEIFWQLSLAPMICVHSLVIFMFISICCNNILKENLLWFVTPSNSEQQLTTVVVFLAESQVKRENQIKRNHRAIFRGRTDQAKRDGTALTRGVTAGSLAATTDWKGTMFTNERRWKWSQKLKCNMCKLKRQWQLNRSSRPSRRPKMKGKESYMRTYMYRIIRFVVYPSLAL